MAKPIIQYDPYTPIVKDVRASGLPVEVELEEITFVSAEDDLVLLL